MPYDDGPAAGEGPFEASWLYGIEFESSLVGEVEGGGCELVEEAEVRVLERDLFLSPLLPLPESVEMKEAMARR